MALISGSNKVNLDSTSGNERNSAVRAQREPIQMASAWHHARFRRLERVSRWGSGGAG
jgi:hypothetical protein